MNELSWTAIRAEAIDRFQGQTPRPEDETQIIDIFVEHPQLVMRAIDEIATALGQGKITWAWSTLRARLLRGTAAIREAKVDISSSRNSAIERAETWMRNAGCHYDLERHITAELFGDPDSGTTGLLQDHDTPELRQRMIELWKQERPRGEQAERDHQAWADHCVESRKRVAAMLKAKQQDAADDLPHFTPTT